jgi:hypothetical protein
MARVAALGCVACSAWGHSTPAEVHHLLSGNKRRGHLATVPLCAWHHRGVIPTGSARRLMEGLLGPSMALQSKRFRELFGSDEDLLAEVNRRLSVGRDLERRLNKAAGLGKP